ncbi:MAG: hypothetical protein IJ917_05475 [Firmicutes bacterium]|nr:hypothetical protein [Bacillota bacterium]
MGFLTHAHENAGTAAPVSSFAISDQALVDLLLQDYMQTCSIWPTPRK